MSELRLAVSELQKICSTRGWTVGTAESCTGGLIAATITKEPGVSSFFRGSVVSYAGDVKVSVLHVPRPLIATHGEVSIPVAIAMAHGVRKTLDCTWAVSVTGIAGPTGGSAEKPVGTTCFAVVGPGFESYASKLFPSKMKDQELRQDIQRQAALFAFDFLLSGMR